MRCTLTDDGLKQLGALKQLKRLELSDTPVTDDSVRHLAGLKKVEMLDLDRTKVTDAGLKRLAEMENHRSLNWKARRSRTRAWKTSMA